MKRVCVVIPMFGKHEYTKKCVDLTIENAGIQDMDILVVDDGSPEKFYHEGAIHLRLPNNTGFTNAANEGLKWVSDRYKYVHLLNNDTEPHPNFIKSLIDVMEEDEKVGIASSVRLHPKGAGYEVELYGIDLIRGFQAVTRLEHLKDEVIQCNWVPLCSSLIRTDMIQYLGLMDKRMKNHSSDLDYCIRAKIHGFNIVVVTDSRVLHHHEVTTSTHKISPEKDQMVLLEKLAGYHYAEFMKAMPLDAESKTYGKLDFTVYKK